MNLYRLNFDLGGHTESADLQQLKDMRAISSGTIVAIQKNWTITNDPQLREFTAYEDAENAFNELRNSAFQINETMSMEIPQPEGLND